MIRKWIALAAAAILASCAVPPPGAQVNVAAGYGSGYGYDYGRYGGGYSGPVDYDYFRYQLSPYGDWYFHPRWGRVWKPRYVGADFRPYYTNGYWADTFEFGATWISDYPWGRIPFHYGRWVYDPFDHWIWLPGYVWAPSWVIWRSGGGYIGWFPMPPTNDFLIGIEVYDNDWRNWDRSFGYSDWYGPNYGSNWSLTFWAFVDNNHFGSRDFRRWDAPRARRQNLIRNTTNVTNYVTINNYVVNRSVEEPARRQPGQNDGWQRQRARDVLGDQAPVTQASIGQQIQERERPRFGGDVNASPRERIRPLPEGTPPNPPAGGQGPAPQPPVVQQPTGRNPPGARTTPQQRQEEERAARQQQLQQQQDVERQRALQRQQQQEQEADRQRVLQQQQQQQQQQEAERQRTLQQQQQQQEAERQRALQEQQRQQQLQQQQQEAERQRAPQQQQQQQLQDAQRRDVEQRRAEQQAERERLTIQRQQQEVERAAQREQERREAERVRAQRQQDDAQDNEDEAQP